MRRIVLIMFSLSLYLDIAYCSTQSRNSSPSPEEWRIMVAALDQTDLGSKKSDHAMKIFIRSLGHQRLLHASFLVYGKPKNHQTSRSGNKPRRKGLKISGEEILVRWLKQHLTHIPSEELLAQGSSITTKLVAQRDKLGQPQKSRRSSKKPRFNTKVSPVDLRAEDSESNLNGCGCSNNSLCSHCPPRKMEEWIEAKKEEAQDCGCPDNSVCGHCPPKKIEERMERARNDCDPSNSNDGSPAWILPEFSQQEIEHAAYIDRLIESFMTYDRDELDIEQRVHSVTHLLLSQDQDSDFADWSFVLSEFLAEEEQHTPPGEWLLAPCPRVDDHHDDDDHEWTNSRKKFPVWRLDKH